VREFCSYLLPRLDENDALLTGNEIFLVRTKDVGILPLGLAVEYGISGGMLRGSGPGFDVRKVDPYAVYDRFDFDIPYQTTQDCLGRYVVRVEEMRQSVRIIHQALDMMPEGPIMAKLPRTLRPSAAEVYTRIESPRGVMGVYLVSDGGTNPLRMKWRAPSFCNLQVLPEMVRGLKIADLVAVLGSIDIVLGDVDR
jgi:NADH-quinone oxidoreductase subunit D